jgi:hypothetical protein
MSAFKNAKVQSGKRIHRTGEEYTPVEIKNPSSAMNACLHLFMSHSVDFFAIMLDIIADKYGISKDEMVEAVMKDPRMKNMSVNPVIHSLGYFEQDDLEKTFAKMNMKPEEQPQPPQPQKKNIIFLKKKSKPTTPVQPSESSSSSSSAPST